MQGGEQPRRLVLLTVDGGGSGAVAYDGEHVCEGRMIKISGSQIVVTVALAAFAVAAWAVSRPMPHTPRSEPPRISPPDDTRLEQEGVARGRSVRPGSIETPAQVAAIEAYSERRRSSESERP